MENFITALFEKVYDLLEEYIFPFKILNQYESGLVLRLGKYHRNLKTGWNWKWFLFEKVQSVFHTVNTFHVTNVNVTTKDHKTITVGPIVEYQIIDATKYILDFNEAESNMHDLSRGIIADYLTDCTWEECKKKSTLTGIKNKMKKQYEDMGVEIMQVLFGDIALSPAFTLFDIKK